MRTAPILIALAMASSGTGCGGVATSAVTQARVAGPVLGRSNLISMDEIGQRGHFGDLYDLIHDLRPRWLQSRGPDTFLGRQGEVQVHVDGHRLGGVGVLRTLAAAEVASIEWLGPSDAAARFGPNYSHGTIIISTLRTR